MNLKEFLRKAVDVIFTPTDDITDDNVQDAIGTAYERGSEALNAANSKLDKGTADTLYLGKTAKAADSEKLDGKDSTAFLLTTGTAADSNLLQGQNGAYYRNASNLNAGTVPNARLPSTATRSDDAIKDLAGSLDGGSQTRMSCSYSSGNKTFTFSADVQSDNNFTNAYKSKLDALLPNAWQVVTADKTAVSGDRIMVDMDSTGTITVTLPVSPSAGATVEVGDGSGLAGSGKTLTIGRNGQPIMSLYEDLNVDVPGYLMTLVFLNATRGWVVAN